MRHRGRVPLWKTNYQFTKTTMCQNCEKRTPRQLPIVRIRGKLYFQDDRLRQYRNINDPYEWIECGDVHFLEVEPVQPAVYLGEEEAV